MSVGGIVKFFKRFEVLGWAVIFLASLCLLAFVITAVYFEITANRSPPIITEKARTKNGNKIKAGGEEFIGIPMQWDYSRSCSAYIPISIRGEDGAIYPSPPPIYYSKEAVKKFTELNPSSFEFVITLPSIARPGKAFVTSDPVYICDDNKSLVNNKITFSYVSELEIVK
jgi:hypothetical protein